MTGDFGTSTVNLPNFGEKTSFLFAVPLLPEHQRLRFLPLPNLSTFAKNTIAFFAVLPAGCGLFISFNLDYNSQHDVTADRLSLR